MTSSTGPIKLAIIIVSYNTRELLHACLDSVVRSGCDVPYQIHVLDNASTDGSPEYIRARSEKCEKIIYIESGKNIGFAAANNRLACTVDAEWLLLLNPDTEVYTGSINELFRFATEHPAGGIYGGRTVFPDGSLNIASCWAHQTVWSIFCRAFALSAAFPASSVFNPEAYGSWKRDSIREVGIVVGCFLLIRRELWEELGGFDTSYWMYGEEADLCIRAQKLGYRPLITPKAEIMHLVGASASTKTSKTILVAKAKATLIRRHWSGLRRWAGLLLMLAWAANRLLMSSFLAMLAPGRYVTARDRWREVWGERHDWLRGYEKGAPNDGNC